MLLRELSNYAPSNADEASALVQVGSPSLPGTGQQIGGVTAAQQAQVQASLAQQAANKAAAEAAAAERAAVAGPGSGYVAPPGAIGGFEVPNNFWGFVMLMMGLK